MVVSVGSRLSDHFSLCTLVADGPQDGSLPLGRNFAGVRFRLADDFWLDGIFQSPVFWREQSHAIHFRFVLLAVPCALAVGRLVAASDSQPAMEQSTQSLIGDSGCKCLAVNQLPNFCTTHSDRLVAQWQKKAKIKSVGS